MTRYRINTDGGARGNPGPAGAGFVIEDETGHVVVKDASSLGVQTNNWAEYQAVILALEALKKRVSKEARADAEVLVQLDSELVVKQLNGEYRVKEEPLQLQYMRVHNLRVAHFPQLSFVHIPRAENADADRLANEAMDAGTQGVLG